MAPVIAAGVRLPPEDPDAKTPPRAEREAGQAVREWAWEELNFRPHAYQACESGTQETAGCP